MRRGTLIGMAVLVLTALFSSPCFARLQPLTDEALARVAGQGNISISTDHFAFDMKAANIFYGDQDGAGPGTGPGYISLTDVSLKGSVAFGTPMRLDIVTKTDPKGIQLTSLLFTISDMTLKIDSFYIDAIRLGSAPGKGASLGSFGIENMTVRMTGNFTISVR